MVKDYDSDDCRSAGLSGFDRKRDYYLRCAIFQSSSQNSYDRLRPYSCILVRVSDRRDQRNGHFARRTEYLNDTTYAVGEIVHLRQSTPFLLFVSFFALASAKNDTHEIGIPRCRRLKSLSEDGRVTCVNEDIADRVQGVSHD